MLYRLQGRYSEAESLLTKALTIGRRVQGEENPNTCLRSTNWLNCIEINVNTRMPEYFLAWC